MAWGEKVEILEGDYLGMIFTGIKRCFLISGKLPQEKKRVSLALDDRRLGSTDGGRHEGARGRRQSGGESEASSPTSASHFHL